MTLINCFEAPLEVLQAKICMPHWPRNTCLTVKQDCGSPNSCPYCYSGKLPCLIKCMSCPAWWLQWAMIQRRFICQQDESSWERGRSWAQHLQACCTGGAMTFSLDHVALHYYGNPSWGWICKTLNGRYLPNFVPTLHAMFGLAVCKSIPVWCWRCVAIPIQRAETGLHGCFAQP